MAVSAITGLSYLQSAYASGTLLLNNAESFGVLTISTYFLRLSGVLACSVIPTAASYTILELLAFDNTLITIGSFVVFFYTAVISLVMLSTTTESPRSCTADTGVAILTGSLSAAAIASGMRWLPPTI